MLFLDELPEFRRDVLEGMRQPLEERRISIARAGWRLSYPADAMIVLPCSVGTLARIANGIAAQLIERAADVSLKEKRPLVLCVRESPLSKIHIRNMYRAADAGATIYPLIPTFYNHPKGFEDMARQFADRVLHHIGLPQPGAYCWKG